MMVFNSIFDKNSKIFPRFFIFVFPAVMGLVSYMVITSALFRRLEEMSMPNTNPIIKRFSEGFIIFFVVFIATYSVNLFDTYEDHNQEEEEEEEEE